MKIMRRVLISLATAGAMLLSAASHAGSEFSNKTSQWLQSSINMNVTKPIADSDGHLLGSSFGYGGMSMKFPQETFQPITASAPSISAGCGGIDVRMGGFSFMNGEEFLRFLKSLAMSSIGIAAETALSYYCKPCVDALRGLREWTTKINGIAKTSCEIANTAVGGLASSIDQARQEKCIKDMLAGNRASDRESAARQCSSEQGIAKNSKKDSDELQNINVAWKALRSPELQGVIDDDMAEIIMNMTGSIIVREGDVVIVSTILSDNVVEFLMHGTDGSGSGYPLKLMRCKDGKSADGCLTVDRADFVLPKERSAVYMISQYLHNVVANIVDPEGSPLSPQAEAFVGLSVGNTTTSGNPLYQVLLAYTNISPTLGHDAADLMANRYAYDLIDSLLRKTLGQVDGSRHKIDHPLLSESFAEGIKEARNNLEKISTRMNQRYAFEMSRLSSTASLSQSFRSSLSLSGQGAVAFSSELGF